MRILFVTPAFPPFPGGGERYARSLALQLGRHGNRITVLTSTALAEGDFWHPAGPQQGRREELDENLHVVRCPVAGFPGGRPGLLAWRKAMVLLSTLPGDQSAWLMRMARRVPALHDFEATLARIGDAHDLVHGFNLSWEYPLAASWRWTRRAGLPFVVTPFVHLGAGKGDRVARNTTMDHQRRILADADAVLALTSVERDGLGDLGVPLARIHVVSGGIDPVPPLPEPSTLSAILRRYTVSRPFVVFVGRVSYDKGAIHLAEAARSLMRKGREIGLVLIGSIAPEFEHYWRRLGDDERRHIRALGIIDEIDKHALIGASDMLALPSRTDSFGLVLLEAWAHGKPVIGAHAGGIPGIITDGDTGLLVRFGDVDDLARAIDRLLHDPALRHKLGQRGKSRLASEYSWDHVCDRVLAAYDQARRTMPSN